MVITFFLSILFLSVRNTFEQILPGKLINGGAHALARPRTNFNFMMMKVKATFPTTPCIIICMYTTLYFSPVN